MMKMADMASNDERMVGSAAAPISVVVGSDGDQVTLDDDASSLSSLSSDEEPVASVPESPRSLFSNYWTKQGEAPPRKRPSPRSPSPSCVIRMNPTPDPYEVFGLIDDDDEEEYSTNTYERMISAYDVTPRQTRKRGYEARPLWASWFSSSAPTLSGGCSRGVFASMTTGFRSEPVLHSAPLPSALRKGRFSRDSHKKGCTSVRSAGRHVRFQSKVQIRSFQRPVENWAADGWSSWFGM